MTKRPEFLNKHHENGQTIVVDFLELPQSEAVEVDAWLLQEAAYGSMTWQERCLYEWINENWDAEAA